MEDAMEYPQYSPARRAAYAGPARLRMGFDREASLGIEC